LGIELIKIGSARTTSGFSFMYSSCKSARVTPFFVISFERYAKSGKAFPGSFFSPGKRSS
jgi:hypothetical protein